MIRSPNVWDAPEVYEVENASSDQAGVIDSAINALRPFAGSVVLDVGCGNGFHLPRFLARGAERVIGVEPHLPLVAAARARLDSARVDRAQVLAGEAERIPLPDNSIDIVHARWAYFFGAGCEPGLAEVERVLRPGGVSALIDNDATRSTFGRWFSTAYPAYDPVAVQRFWDRQGYTTIPLTIDWRFQRRREFEAVVGIEFTPEVAARIIAEHQRGAEQVTVDYAVTLRTRRAG